MKYGTTWLYLCTYAQQKMLPNTAKVEISHGIRAVWSYSDVELSLISLVGSSVFLEQDRACSAGAHSFRYPERPRVLGALFLTSNTGSSESIHVHWFCIPCTKKGPAIHESCRQSGFGAACDKERRLRFPVLLVRARALSRRRSAA